MMRRNVWIMGAALGAACSGSEELKTDSLVSGDSGVAEAGADATRDSGQAQEAGKADSGGGDGAVAAGWVGKACAQPSDCAAGAQCLQGGTWKWPGGYCSRMYGFALGKSWVALRLVGGQRVG